MDKLEDLILSHSEIANYGQLSFRFIANGGVSTTRAIGPTGNKVRFITGWMIGNELVHFISSTCFMSFNDFRCWSGPRIQLVTVNSIQGLDTHKCYPYLIAKTPTASVQIDEITGVAQQSDMVFNYIDLPNDPVMIKALDDYVNLCFKV